MWLLGKSRNWMLDIEFEEPTRSECECCGGTSTRLTRFISREGDAHAVYYAAYSDKHVEKRLFGIASLGEWWEDEVPDSRVAFAFEMWTDDENFNVGIIDARASLWSDVTIIGRKLSREEALKHEWISEVFHITDHTTDEDPEIKAFFGGETVQ